MVNETAMSVDEQREFHARNLRMECVRLAVEENKFTKDPPTSTTDLADTFWRFVNG